jgi:uncharacterized membrane protein YeaQ/YmgE (transglycosylase-associated protein family)
MNYFAGLGVWLVIGLAAGVLIRVLYRTALTVPILTVTFGVFGAFIGGMLGTSPYIHHDPSPWRFGGLLGAVVGSLFFAGLYHFMTRKAV